MSKLDYKKMLTEICEFVETDFAEEMSWKTADKGEISQEDTQQMATILGNIYSISHCIHCRSCSGKYEMK